MTNAMLDELLVRMNAAKGGRHEGDISMQDPYWTAKNAYIQALGSSGTHVPIEPNLGVDVISAEVNAVKRSAQLHGENIAQAGKLLGDAQAELILAKHAVKQAEEALDKEKNPEAHKDKTSGERALDEAKLKLEAAEAKESVAAESYELTKSNEPVVEEVTKVARELATRKTDDSVTKVPEKEPTEQELEDRAVIDGHGTAPTTTVRNPLSGQNNPNAPSQWP